MNNQHRPKKKRLLLYVVLAVIFLLILFSWILPSVLSSTVGTKAAVSIYNAFSSKNLKIDNMELGWLKPQTIEGFLLTNNENTKLVFFDSFTTTSSLASLLFQRDLGESKVTRPFLLYQQRLAHATQKDAKKRGAFKVKRRKKKPRLPLFYGDLSLVEGTVRLENHLGQSTTLEGLTIDLSIEKDEGKGVVHLVGKTQAKGQSGSFAISASLDRHTWHALATVKNAPTMLLDLVVVPNKGGAFQAALGPTLDGTFKIKKDTTALSLKTEIDTQNLQAQFEGASENGVFKLSRKAHATLSLTPAFFKTLPQSPSEWELVAPADVTLDINTLAFPLNLKTKEKNGLILDGTASFKRADLTHATLGNFSLSDLLVTIKASSATDATEIFYSGALNGPDAPGSLRGRVSISDLFSKNGAFSPKEARTSFVFEEINLPTALINLFVSNGAFFKALVGPTFSISGKGILADHRFIFEGGLLSKHITSGHVRFQVDKEELTLLSPMTFSYRVTADQVKHALQIEPNVRVPEGGTLLVEVTNLVVPLDQPKTLSFETRLHLDSMAIVGGGLLSPIVISDLNGKLTASSKKQLEFSLQGNCELAEAINQNQLLTEFLGPFTQLSLSGTIDFLKEGAFQIADLRISSDSKHLTTNIYGTIDKTGHFRLNREASISYTLLADRIDDWPFNRNEMVLNAPVEAQFKIKKLEIQLFPFALNSLFIEGQGKVAELSISQQTLLGSAEFNDVNITFSLDGKSGTLDLFSQGETSYTHQNKKNKGTFESKTTVTHLLQEGLFNKEKIKGALTLKLNAFPLFVIDAWQGHEGDLVTLFGPSLDLTFDGRYDSTQEKRIVVDAKGESEGFSVAVSFSINGKLEVYDKKEAHLNWEITPARYHTLLHLLKGEDPFPRSDFILTNTANLSIKLTDLTCPSEPPKGILPFLCQSGLSANVSLSAMNLVNQVTRDQVHINSVQGTLYGADLSQQVALELKGIIETHNIPSGFELAVTAIDVLTSKGKINFDKLLVRTDLKVKELPVKALTEIIPFSNNVRAELRALLGETLTASLHAEISHLTGPITLTVKSERIEASLPFFLEKGVLYLQNRGVAKIVLTEQIGKTLLKDVSPLLVTALKSDEPIRIFIEPEGFRAPLQPFSFKSIVVEKAILDLGKIQVINGGEVQSLMDFLKAKEISQEGGMEAWFTPIFFNLKEGILSCKRFDVLLANSVHIASWGSIDFFKDKVRMTLAIAPETMQKKFGLPGLTKNDYFQVKMRGSINDVSLDWSNAYTRIGIIIARTAGGGPNFLIGGLVELLGSTFGEEKTPPPTTTPFPWQKDGADEPKFEEAIPEDQTPKPSKKKRSLKRLFDYISFNN